MGMNPLSILYQGTGVEVFCPGFDTIINCHLGLTNLLSVSVPKYDDLTVPLPYSHTNKNRQDLYHRSTHPGSGAFTPYFNGTSKVKIKKTVIPPYTELFKDYGDHWFEGRTHIFGNIPLSADYDEIFLLLQKFTFLQVTQNTMTSSTQPTLRNDEEVSNNKNTIIDAAAELYELIVYHFKVKYDSRLQKMITVSSLPAEQRNTILHDLYETLMLPLKDRYDSRTLNALPPTFQDAIYIGNSSSRETLTNYLLKQHSTNFEYLQEYGTCIDQIRPGRSTLSNAGHGGFATRPFRKGTIITASPLLIIPDENVLYMYNFTKYNHRWYRNYKKKKHYQLLYNYCYGHPYSTLLLCPHGGGINYINHNQSLVNVKMEWTTTQLSHVHNATLVQHGTMEEMTNLASEQQGSQLVFHYVAIQDIQPNDELFLDYGDEWEAAWQYHIQQYPYSNHNHRSEHEDDNENEPTSSSSSSSNYPPPSPKYISAQEYNYYHSNALLRTMDEQMVEPYPNNLQIRCHRSLYLEYSSAIGIYEWAQQDYGLPCRILDRWIETSMMTSSLHMDLYTVQLEYVPTHTVMEHHYSDDQWNDNTAATAIWVNRTDVPRSAIRFFDTPYTTDLHQSYAFRHYIPMDDEIFPSQWKNLH